MSIQSNHFTVKEAAIARGLLSGFAASVKRWAIALFKWRVEQAAMAALEAMSDRELKDIGLSRSDIERSVRLFDLH